VSRVRNVSRTILFSDGRFEELCYPKPFSQLVFTDNLKGINTVQLVGIFKVLVCAAVEIAVHVAMALSGRVLSLACRLARILGLSYPHPSTPTTPQPSRIVLLSALGACQKSDHLIAAACLGWDKPISRQAIQLLATGGDVRASPPRNAWGSPSLALRWSAYSRRGRRICASRSLAFREWERRQGSKRDQLYEQR
jgi:hypothetical protein